LFLELGVEIFREITRKLKVIEWVVLRLVCKAFNTITHHPDLWRKVNLSGKVYTPEALALLLPDLQQTQDLTVFVKKLITLGPGFNTLSELRSLSLQGCAAFRDIGLVCEMLKNNSKLCSLNIQACSFGGKLDTLSSTPAMSQLTTLKMGSLNVPSIKPIFEHATRLRVLDVTANFKVPTPDFVASAKVFPESLTDLSMRGCPQLSDAAIVEMGTRCTNLTRLDLGKCPRITTGALKGINNLTQLNQLQMPGLELVVPEAFEGLSLPNITSLNLSRTGLTDSGLLKFLCPGLTYLNVASTGVTDACLEYVANHTKALKVLDLTYCKGVTDVSALPQCLQLDVLDLLGTNVSNHNDIYAILDLPQLYKIELGRSAVTEETVEYLCTKTTVCLATLECRHLAPEFMIRMLNLLHKRLYAARGALLKASLNYPKDFLQTHKESCNFKTTLF